MIFVMDYLVGSVAALVTGNVTPSRPRLIKRALTPTKHPPSPNVTPKSEFVEDRSIFLSPSMQKKKAIVKKSPKRIFQNPDLETTVNGEGNLSATSPKAEKVKKHLKDDLERDSSANKSAASSKSPSKKDKNKKESNAPGKTIGDNFSNENTPKKKKKKNNSENQDELSSVECVETETSTAKSPKIIKQRHKLAMDNESNTESHNIPREPQISNVKQKPNNLNSKQTTEDAAEKTVNNQIVTKKNKKCKKKRKVVQQNTESTEIQSQIIIAENLDRKQANVNKNNRECKKSKSRNKPDVIESIKSVSDNEDDDETTAMKNKKSKMMVNPNAVTDKESDSEHESDDEIESENEEINKKVFETEPAAPESSDNEDEGPKAQESKQKPENEETSTEKSEINTEDEIKRTLFVGNVPFSTKCKKEIKKIFNKHGQIETIRIRTVPVKDGRYTPKLAVIKNELHPERTTVNVYIKYAEEESVVKALSENNTLLNEHHLRVSRSSNTGAEHDPKCSIFVGNLPFAVEDEVLRKKFESCGEIESVRVIRDKKTNAGKGFGYVNFSSKDAVELALALTEEDLTIKNRIIRVKRCTQLTNKQKQSPDKKNFKKPFNNRVQEDQRHGQGNQRAQSGQRNFGQGKPNQRNQGFRGNHGGPRPGSKDAEGRDGAHRRIMHKRKNQEGNATDGPPNKRQRDLNQPGKEKKSRKEFVGMTAEKKKKRKFDKGQKKKKALSEILTK